VADADRVRLEQDFDEALVTAVHPARCTLAHVVDVR
jgi:hypothetical protein